MPLGYINDTKAIADIFMFPVCVLRLLSDLFCHFVQ